MCSVAASWGPRLAPSPRRGPFSALRAPPLRALKRCARWRRFAVRVPLRLRPAPFSRTPPLRRLRRCSPASAGRVGPPAARLVPGLWPCCRCAASLRSLACPLRPLVAPCGAPPPPASPAGLAPARPVPPRRSVPAPASARGGGAALAALVGRAWVAFAPRGLLAAAAAAALVLDRRGLSCYSESARGCESSSGRPASAGRPFFCAAARGFAPPSRPSPPGREAQEVTVRFAGCCGAAAPRFGAAVALLIVTEKRWARAPCSASIFEQNGVLFCSIAGVHKIGPPLRPLPRLYGCGPLRGCGPTGRALRLGSPNGPSGLGLVTPLPTKSTFCSTGRRKPGMYPPSPSFL